MQRFALKSRPGRSTNYPLSVRLLLRPWRSTLGQQCGKIVVKPALVSAGFEPKRYRRSGTTKQRDGDRIGKPTIADICWKQFSFHDGIGTLKLVGGNEPRTQGIVAMAETRSLGVVAMADVSTQGPSSVPEPSPLLLLVLGLGCVAIWRHAKEE